MPSKWAEAPTTPKNVPAERCKAVRSAYHQVGRHGRVATTTNGGADRRHGVSRWPGVFPASTQFAAETPEAFTAAPGLGGVRLVGVTGGKCGNRSHQESLPPCGRRSCGTSAKTALSVPTLVEGSKAVQLADWRIAAWPSHAGWTCRLEAGNLATCRRTTQP